MYKIEVRDQIYIVIVATILAIVMATRIDDVSNENINSWFFAKLFLSNPEFIVLPRSPLYQLYLTPFTMLPHPTSIIVERSISTFICFIPIALLLCKIFTFKIGIITAIFAAPDLVLVEPTAQAFAFSLSCLAFFLRLKFSHDRFKSYNLFYSLLILVWSLRSNFIILLVLFAMWDLFRVAKNKQWKLFFEFFNFKVQWPILLCILFCGLTVINQSSHRWNNYQGIEQDWLPATGQLASVISINAATHFQEDMPRLDGEQYDIYFVHKKIFGNSSTIFEMLYSNPKAIFKHISRNFRAYLTTTVSMTNVGQILFSFTTFGRKSFSDTTESMGRIDHRFITIIFSIIFGAMFVVMALQFYKNIHRREMLIFILALLSISTVAALLAKGDTNRFIFVIYGVYACMAAYFAEQFMLYKKKFIGLFLALSIIILLTQGGWVRPDVRHGWGGVFRALKDYKPTSITEFFYSGKHAQTIKLLNKEAKDCIGLITLEMPQLIGAFANLPENILYSPFEIPPFGTYELSSYAGLRKDRINCIYVPKQMLKKKRGAVTNIQLRYQAYIKSYIKELLKNSGERITLPSGILFREIR